MVTMESLIKENGKKSKANETRGNLNLNLRKKEPFELRPRPFFNVFHLTFVKPFVCEL